VPRIGGLAVDTEHGRVLVGLLQSGEIWSFPHAEAGRSVAEFPTASRVIRIAFIAGPAPHLVTLDGTLFEEVLAKNSIVRGWIWVGSMHRCSSPSTMPSSEQRISR
jgi:hypothetical protein